MKINLRDLTDKYGSKAKSYFNDKGKTKKLIDDAIKKVDNLEKSGPLEKLWEHLRLFFGLIRDWANGSYKHISKGSILLIIIGLIYLVTPFDVIPDFIPFIGYTDDAFVLSLIIKQVSTDLENYRAWKLYKSAQVNNPN